MSRKSRGWCLFVIASTLGMSSAAWADVLQLGGSYGNPVGCEFLKTNDYSEDSMIALTANGYQTYVTGCEFLQALTARNGDKVVTAICGHEGEAESTIELMRVRKLADADAYEIYAQSGDLLGRADRCPD